MVINVQLIHDGEMYILYTPIDADPNKGSIKTCFPYSNLDKNKALKTARKWATKRASFLKIPLEEKL